MIMVTADHLTRETDKFIVPELFVLYSLNISSKLYFSFAEFDIRLNKNKRHLFICGEKISLNNPRIV